MKTYDAVIIGGGIIGGSIACELAGKGLRVILLEKQQLGREASWAAAGMLSASPDSADSPHLFPLAKASYDLYPEFNSRIEEVSGASACYRRQGSFEIFHTAAANEDRARFVDEHRRLGVIAEAVSCDQARRTEPAIGPAARGVAWLPDEATVDPRLLSQAVFKAARQLGAEIRDGTAVEGILLSGEKCEGVRATREKVYGKHTILAAGCFSSRIESMRRYAPTRPVRGQMVALQPEKGGPRHVLRSGHGYLVPRPDGRVIAGSTLEEAGYEKRVTPSGLRQILSAAIDLAPSLADAEIIETWSGLRPGTPDNLPILGPVDLEGLFIATGHYRNGVLLAPATARLTAEWLTTRKTSLDISAFSPLRFAAETQSTARIAG